MNPEHDAFFTGRPTWDRAPTWAQWLAQDGNGSWYWYAERPSYDEQNRRWAFSEKELFKYAGHNAPPADAWDTREQRPASKTDAQERNERQVAVNELQEVAHILNTGGDVKAYLENRIKELLK